MFFSDEAWKALLHHLYSLSTAQLEYLSTLPETEHYVTRILAHIHINENEKSEYSKITQCFLLLFPQLVVCIDSSVKEKIAVRQRMEPPQSRRHFKSLPTSDSSNHPFESRRRRSLYQYSHDDLPVTFQKKRITIDDLALAVDTVKADALALDRMNQHPGQTLLLAHAYTAGTLQKKAGKPSLQPVLPCELPPLPESMPKVKEIRSVKLVKTGSKSKRILQAYFGQSAVSRDENGKFLIKTGVDVVQAFALGRQAADTDEFYLNFKDTTPWNPYHLLVVPESQAHPEHLVASKFGFLHVYPNGESKFQSFSKWCRDAAIFSIIRQIPVFKYYLLKKMIRQWHETVCRMQFYRMWSAVANNGIRFHRNFGLSLWKINSLSQDLLCVTFHEVASLGCYSKDQFQRQTQQVDNKIFKLLQKYFKYCHRILLQTIAQSQSNVLELETKKRHQPFVSDLPISVQKARHVQLSKDLEHARHRASQLKMFVTSVQQMVEACLVELVQQNSINWLSKVISGESRKGMITIKEESGNDDDDSSELERSLAVADERKSMKALLTSHVQAESEGTGVSGWGQHKSKLCLYVLEKDFGFE